MSKKDLINVRKKEKVRFITVLVLSRIKYKGKFKEINIKLFNTGKLKIPGIKDIETLHLSINFLVETINTISDLNVKFLEEKLETV